MRKFWTREGGKRTLCISPFFRTIVRHPELRQAIRRHFDDYFTYCTIESQQWGRRRRKEMKGGKGNNDGHQQQQMPQQECQLITIIIIMFNNILPNQFSHCLFSIPSFVSLFLHFLLASPSSCLPSLLFVQLMKK